VHKRIEGFVLLQHDRSVKVFDTIMVTLTEPIMSKAGS
jgi:hypothetical protein